MNKLATAAIVSVMLAGGASMALADSDGGKGRYEMEHHGSKHHGYGHHGYGKGCRSIDRMADELNLDEKQVAKMRAIQDKYRPKTQALRDKYRDNRKALRALMDKDKVKESDIRKLADAQGKIKADKIVLKSKMKLEMDEVLTKEQRAKWKEMRESRRRDS